MKTDISAVIQPEFLRRYIFYIFLLGLFLRIAFFTLMREYPLLYLQSLDETYYLDFGKSIAFGASDGRVNTFFMDPLYGHFLGVIFLLFGDNLTILRLIQILVDSFNVFIIYFVGCKVWDNKAGTIAALIWATYIVSFYYSLLILKVTIAVSAMLLFTWLLLKIVETDRINHWFFAGFIAGILNYIRANFILILPLTLLCYWFIEGPAGRRFLKNGLAFLMGAMLLLSLNAIRTYIATGSPSLFITSSGRILYCCNHPDNTTGIYDVPSFSRSHPIATEQDFHKEAELRTGRALSPKEASTYWQTETFHVLKDNMHIIPVLIFNKLKWILANYEIPMNQSYALAADFAGTSKWPFPNYAFVIAFGFPGLIGGMVMKRKVQWLLVPMLAVTLTLMVFYVSSRFRMPMVPYLIIGTAIYFSLLHDQIRQKDWKKIMLMLCISLILFIISISIPPPAGDGHKESGLAKAFYLQNDYQNAKNLALASIRKYPDNLDLYIVLGRIMTKEGRIDQAIKYYENALKFNKDNFTINYDLAMIYLKKENPEYAIPHLKKCLTLKHHVDSMLSLAEAYEACGLIPQAVQYYKDFLEAAGSDDPRREFVNHKLSLLR